MRRLCTFIMILLLSGCAARADPDTAQESIQLIAMDTPMLISTYGAQSVPAACAAEDCIRDLASGEHTLFAPTGLLAAEDTLYVCDNYAGKLFAISL